MPHFQNSNRFRTCLLAASLVFPTALFADLSTTSPLVPPADGIYYLANTCISVVCLENISIADFVPVSSMIIGGNEVTESDVTLSANMFQNVSGMPGTPIGPVQLTGQADITYFSKIGLSESGTFNDQLTLLDLTGEFLGLDGREHMIDAMLNPDFSSLGQTTITPQPLTGGTPTFIISSFFDVFAELKIDSGPFVPGPERGSSLAPEPSYYALTGCLFAALIVRRISGRKRTAV
jgi:hypothetical protein